MVKKAAKVVEKTDNMQTESVHEDVVEKTPVVSAAKEVSEEVTLSESPSSDASSKRLTPTEEPKPVETPKRLFLKIKLHNRLSKKRSLRMKFRQLTLLALKKSRLRELSLLVKLPKKLG